MKNLLALSILFFSLTATAQNKNDSLKINQLKIEIIKMNRLLFTVAFNQCNLELFKKIIAEDVEFYDDSSGLNNSKQIEIKPFVENVLNQQNLQIN